MTTSSMNTTSLGWERLSSFCSHFDHTHFKIITWHLRSAQAGGQLSHVYVYTTPTSGLSEICTYQRYTLDPVHSVLFDGSDF